MRRMVSLLLVAIFVLTTSTIALADQISDKKRELEDVKKKIDETKGELSKVKSEQDRIVGQIAEVELELEENKEQLEEVETLLTVLREDIDITQSELDEATAKAELHKDLMDQRICAMYMGMGNSNAEIISVMLDAKSITDFLDRLTMVREIMTLDKNVFDEMKAIEKEIEDKKESLEEQRDIEEDTKKDIETQKTLIEEKRRQKESLLSKLKEQRHKVEQNLSELERNSENIDATIRRLVAERAERERRERERRAREQAANNRDSGSSSRGGGSSQNTPTPPKATGSASSVVNYAMGLRGKRYVYGTAGPNTFDCSGFSSYVYRQFGVSIPRTSSAQSNWTGGTKISSRSALRGGDLVFFAKGGRVYHVGIYIGGGQFVHASNSKTGVIVSNINSGSYSRNFVWGRRILK